MRFSQHFYLMLNIYLIVCHNIIRLPTVRKARFELRHRGKVHVKEHYRELKIKGNEVCVDRCVTDPRCKSVNFLEITESGLLDRCQLVAYDITDNSTYVNRTGWKHYDTGRTSVTRIRQKSTGKCWVPFKSGCSNDPKEGYPIELVSADDPRCNTVDAFFEFVRDTGALYHYCTGKFVCPYLEKDGETIEISTSDHCNRVIGQKMSYIGKRWRLTQGFTLAYYHFCLHPRVEHSTGKTLFYLIDRNNCYTEGSEVDLVDLERGPIKVSVMTGATHQGFEGSLQYLLNHPQYSNPYKIFYANEFDWYVPTPFDQFGFRMQALIHVPYTGEVRFWVHVKGTCIYLWIGDDENESSKKLITSGAGPMSMWSWDRKKSGVKYLEEGKRYYIEVLYQSGTMQQLYIAMEAEWTNRVPVSHDYLEPYLGP